MNCYSVLMSVYCREEPENLRLAVESMLEQTVAPSEFVLVCDGPLTRELDDVIAEFCAGYPALFHILRLEENQGLGAALNAGLRQCRYELVARMDSDDIALPDRMRLQLEAWEACPGLSVLGGQIAEFSHSPDHITAYRQVPTETEAICAYLKRRSPMNHTTTLLRKSHVLEAGGYEAVAGFEDYFLWIKLISRGFSMANIPQLCCRVRADAAMYRRRGGWQYFKNTVKMEAFLLRSGLITVWECGQNVAVRFVGAMLIPVKLRRLAFLRFLRLRALEETEDRGGFPLYARAERV